MNVPYRLEVLVHGRPIKVYSHEGEAYVEGRKGSEFTLRVHNDSSGNIEAVITIDGLSVMNGKKGGYAVGGYLVRPYSYVDVPGWRLSNSAVAKFLFSEREEAYASLMDVPDNIGVIGCAVFPEKVKIPVFRDDDRPHLLGGPQTFGGRAMRGSASKGVGCGFGQQIDHKVTEVQFERLSLTVPTAVLKILYGDKAQLKEWGVPLQESPKVALNPFPCEPTGCVPPPGWRGGRR